MSEREQDSCETCADIADMIRRAVESMGDELPYTVSAGTMRRVADRIKAAWRREKVEIYAAWERKCVEVATKAATEGVRLTNEKYANKPGNAAAHAMTLDEAIAHAEEVADRCDTSCGREHRQLADWLKELRDVKSQPVGNAAAMREALVTIRKRLVAEYVSESEFMRLSPDKPLADLIDAALSAPERN